MIWLYDKGNPIAIYLDRSCGISAKPEQIIVGSGAEYLYSLIVQLLGKERSIALEDPSYEKIKQVYEASGATCEMLKLGKDGIKTDELEKTKATVLHITPFNSFPSGITASASKRSEYIKWAKKRGGCIIEDNYDSIIFKDDGIDVIFKPHTISDYDNEIVVSIDYNQVIGYLNGKYFNMQDTSKEINTNVVSKKYDRIRPSKDFENKKLIALTFDDGPSYRNTTKLINELDKRDARVTFFMLGQLALRQKELVKEVYDRGHTIGSHTYDHKNLKKLDLEQLKFEVDYTNEILSDITQDEVRFLRPPYGAYNKDILDNVNMAFILWNVDTLDWKLKDAQKVCDYIVKNAKDGDIILLHDIHSTSVDGVIMAIDILKNEGYEFVSLDEMLVYRNISIQNNKAYRFFK